jgi:hypothetical protein
MAHARLELTDGTRVHFRAVMRWLFDGGEVVRTLVDKVGLK